jgi:hypothetical protein
VTDRPVVYRHRQVGYLTLVVLIVVAITADAAVLAAHAPPGVLAAVAVTSLVLLIVALVFSSLTVEIDDRELRACFGPGITAKRVALVDVAKAEVMPSSFWNGWGIRLTTRGMLYNVSGYGAVEVTLTTGQRFRIGTDEMERLKEAIERAAGLESRKDVR